MRAFQSAAQLNLHRWLGASRTARCTKAVPVDNYPEGFSYDPETQVLAVGDGEFAPLAPEVWNYSVSGFQVVKSWLDRRKLNR